MSTNTQKHIKQKLEVLSVTSYSFSSPLSLRVGMWRELLHKCGVLMHTAVGREWVPAKNCLGLLNVDGADIPSGSLLAAIPMTSCCSPALLRQSAEWGSISSTIPGYSVTRNAINFECSEETLQTAVHVALMAQQRVSSSSHPVSRYIHFILRAERAEDSGLIRNRWRDTTNPAIVEGIGQSVEDLEIVKTKVLENLLGLLNQWVKPPMTLESLHAANYLCESRCVEVVHEKYDVFEGPAFVPFLDLINHATQPNITVQLTPSPFLISHLRRNRSVSSIPASEVDNHVPFYVTVYADRAISPGDELEYPYLEENNPTLWASRFHFIPEPCVGEQQPVANVPE